MQPLVYGSGSVVNQISSQSSGTHFNITNKHQANSDLSLQGLKASLSNFKMSDQLRQRINGILDKEEMKDLKAEIIYKKGNKNSLEDRQFDLESKFTKSPRLNATVPENLGRLNMSSNSGVLMSPRLENKAANDSFYQRSSKFNTPMYTQNREFPAMFQFVITKPILTGDLVFSDQTFGSVLPESDSIQKIQFEFTPASTILNLNNSPTNVLNSPEVRKGQTPPRPFVIKLEESYRLTPSLQKDTAQFIESQLFMQNKDTPKSATRSCNIGKKIDLPQKIDQSMSNDSDYHLKSRPSMVDKAIQTNQTGCKSIATQTFTSSINTGRHLQSGNEETIEIRTVRRTGENSLLKSIQSQGQDTNTLQNAVTSIKVPEPVLDLLVNT